MQNTLLSRPNKYFCFAKRFIHPELKKNASSEWLPVIGLEIHAQIARKSKLFSGSSTNNYAPLNSVVSFYDCSLPGTLPVLNKSCVEAAVLTALALKCRINHVSRFDRKHYFYADLPAGYQITQFSNAIANNGELEYYVFDRRLDEVPYKKKTKVLQLQLEQDSGKSIVDEAHNRTLIDYNRVGCGLMEIVLDHNITSPLEAGCLLKEIISLLRSIGTCECKLERGNFRVDANVSVHKEGTPLGTRTEVKNLNSIRFVQRAIEYEIQRQIALLENGSPVVNETRTFDFRTKSTIPMRDKEVRQDYRYMPEPNLPPLHIFSSGYPPPDCTILEPASVINIDDIKSCMPETYSSVRNKMVNVYKIPISLLLTLEEEVGCIDFLQRCLVYECDARFIAQQISYLNFWLIIIMKSDFEKCGMDPKFFVSACTLYKNEEITHQIFTKLLDINFSNKSEAETPLEIVHKNDWLSIRDQLVIADMCEKILVSQPELVKEYLKGKEKILKKFVGQANANFRGRVDYYDLQECFIEKLQHMRQ